MRVRVGEGVGVSVAVRVEVGRMVGAGVGDGETGVTVGNLGVGRKVAETVTDISLVAVGSGDTRHPLSVNDSINKKREAGDNLFMARPDYIPLPFIK
jgi:hypothetical protein